MDGPIIGYVRICNDPLIHGGILNPIWAQKMFSYLNFTRILWFFWDLRLTLLIIRKDAVFAEILAFSNIFGFPVVKCAPIWTETVTLTTTETLTTFHLSQNSRFWRIFQTLFFFMETTSGQSFSRIKQYFRE